MNDLERITRSDVSAAMAIRGVTVVSHVDEGPRCTYQECVCLDRVQLAPPLTAAEVRKMLRRFWLRAGGDPFRFLAQVTQLRDPEERAAHRRLVADAAAAITRLTREPSGE